jgi:hypothetical protein
MPTTQPSKIAGRGLVNEAEFARKSGGRGSGGGMSPQTTKAIKIGVVVVCLIVAGVLIAMQFAGEGARERAGQPIAATEPLPEPEVPVQQPSRRQVPPPSVNPMTVSQPVR